MTAGAALQAASADMPGASGLALASVRRLVRDRAVLRPGYDRVWPAIARCGEALAGEWAHATMALVQVNAGPACIAAFWRVAADADSGALRSVMSSGFAAAGICREAGTKAALACLEQLPTALRLTRPYPAGLAAWWQGLGRLAREAPALVAGTMRHTDRLLSHGGVGFAEFVAVGLKATARDKARRAAYFALQDPLALATLGRHAGAAGFAGCERMVAAFGTGLWGRAARVEAAPGAPRRTVIASGTVLLPPTYNGVSAARARELYRAAAAHAQAHLAVPPVRYALLQLKPLQVAMIGLIEDARIETLAIGRFPGLRRLWAGFHAAQPGGVQTAETLMARLARALLDPATDDGDGFVVKGCALFRAAPEQWEDPLFSRRIGGLLANDLGQMRLAFNARTFVVEPAYRDDNTHLWDLPETLDDALSLTVETARGLTADDAATERPGEADPAPRARDAGPDTAVAVLATYPEWDAAAGVERPDWTTLRDTLPVARTPAAPWPGEAALHGQIRRLVRGHAVGERVRQARREDGAELDLDAAIAAVVARRAGVPPDGRCYRDVRPRLRDLATLIILDVSQSTAVTSAPGVSVLEAQRRAVAALAPALHEQGDQFAIQAFASAGRDDVRLTRVKDLAEPFGPAVAARLAGLSSGLSTRLGAALRHAGATLGPARATRKLLLVLTDGEPADIDVPQPGELVEDARRAAIGLRLCGIDVFGIIMDPAAVGSGTTIFGRHNTLAVRRLDELPTRLASVYFRLAQR